MGLEVPKIWGWCSHKDDTLGLNRKPLVQHVWQGFPSGLAVLVVQPSSLQTFQPDTWNQALMLRTCEYFAMFNVFKGKNVQLCNTTEAKSWGPQFGLSLPSARKESRRGQSGKTALDHTIGKLVMKPTNGHYIWYQSKFLSGWRGGSVGWGQPRDKRRARGSWRGRLGGK